MDTHARDLPQEFRRHMIGTFGAAAERWFDALPALLEDCERRWDLRLHEPFALSYSYVAPATRSDGTPVVVKAGVPNEELRWQIDALRAFAGDAAVQLLDADPDAGVSLLERISPGTMLMELSHDDEATSIAARIMTALRRTPPDGHTFPTLDDWWKKAADHLHRRYSGGTGPLPAALVARAAATFARSTASNAMLLHGDVHQENILLDSARGWLAIDPQGVIGEPAYETGTFVRNQLVHRADAARVLARRVDLLAEHLSMHRARIIEWALAHCVMSACWSLESQHDGWQEAITVAEMLAELAV
jgi:streptomycin 6-kinase